jgi:hypothetical protein
MCSVLQAFRLTKENPRERVIYCRLTHTIANLYKCSRLLLVKFNVSLVQSLDV